MKMATKKQYDEMVKQASPGSPVLKNCVLAFLFGGFVCTVGQLLLKLYMDMGLAQKDARAAVSLSLIFIAAVMTALKIFDKAAKHAGAGMLVPITGFANSMVSSAMEFKTEGLIMGVGGKMFTVAGPVLVYGFAASVVYGIILFIYKLATGG